MSAEALPPAIGITPEGAIIEQPQPNASSSQDIPAHSAPSAAPIDPLLSHEALSQGVHTNTAPEKDVRFLPPSTRLSLNSLLPKEESPAVANEEEKSKPLETSDAVGGVTGIVGGMVASRETVDAGVDAGVETESPIRPAEFEVEVPKTGWEMDMDVSAILNRKNNTHPYIAACKQASVVPVSYILDRLDAAEIIMPHHGLGPKGAEAFAKVLGSNPTLKHLDLMYNGIEAGGAEIGRSLQINRALTTLVLTGNRLGFDGSAEIADMLQFNSTLAVLILKENNIGDKEAQLFAEGLRHNSSLHTLDLSDNQIGDIGAIALGVGLSGNDSLRDLNLSWNHIRQRGIAGLLNGIKDNNMMTSLNLEANGIGDNGQAVAMFLSKNNIVQVLNLRRTRLSDAALAPIAKVLEQNYGIKELDISDNSWSHVAAPALFKALLNSTSIEKLYMRNIKLPRETRLKLAELIRDKPDLQLIEISESDADIARKEGNNGMGISKAFLVEQRRKQEAEEGEREAEKEAERVKEAERELERERERVERERVEREERDREEREAREEEGGLDKTAALGDGGVADEEGVDVNAREE